MKLTGRTRTALVLFAFAAAFITLTVSSYVGESATWDEPFHLTTGYSALKVQDYRVDPEHPPFLRMWCALPLLLMENVWFDTENPHWQTAQQWLFGHNFVYQHNDADRLMYRARFMTVLLGVLLGILIFSWARDLFGFWPATITLGIYTIEPNILAHFRLITTDGGVTCFIFGTVYFLWRTLRHFTWPNLAGFCVFFALAQISKFSSLLLLPIVFLLLLFHIVRNQPWPCRWPGFSQLAGGGQRLLASLLLVLLAGFAAWIAMWASYGFRYAPTSQPASEVKFQSLPEMQITSPKLTRIANWIDRNELLPNACIQGFLLGQIKAQRRGAYLAGEFSERGWWYYFPFAFAIKTPIVLIGLFAFGTLLAFSRREMFLKSEVYVVVPIVVFMGMAMLAKLNIGLRHILPVYPFVILLAGRAVHECRLADRAKVIVVALVIMTLEVAWVCPHYLTFFNAFVGGPSQGHKFLVDSNLDWGQDLKPLAAWIKKNYIQQINLGYFGTADPSYYGIHATHLPGAPFYLESQIRKPELPGWVAVSYTNLRAVYLGEGGRKFYKPLLERTPYVVIGNSICVYWVDQPWWKP